MSNPIDTPRAHDTFRLDGVDCPGLAKIDGDGKRTQEWQEMQQPGTTGANVIFRYEHVARVTYAVKLWTVEHFAAWDSLIATLNAGKDQRPPKVYTLSDLRLEHNRIRRVAYAECGPQEEGDQVGSWVYKLSFVEKPTQKPMGGPLKAPANAMEKDLLRVNAESEVLTGALANMDKARALKK